MTSITTNSPLECRYDYWHNAIIQHIMKHFDSAFPVQTFCKLRSKRTFAIKQELTFTKYCLRVLHLCRKS